MGLLTEGQPLDWESTQKFKDHVKQHGIQQFINLYLKLKERKNDEFKWGDEMECLLVHFNDKEKKAQLALLAEKVLPILQKPEEEAKITGDESRLIALWKPEVGAFMIESCPGTPYLSDFEGIKHLEENMLLRRKEANKVLPENVFLVTFSAFPRLGCPEFTVPKAVLTPHDESSVLRSLFFPDVAMYLGHPRFPTIARSIIARRGGKPPINTSIWMDKFTPRNFLEDFSSLGDNGYDQAHAKPGHVYMDSEGFGASCCSLQMTFQARNTDEGRHLYDQLIPLTPILLALTAGSPIFRGYLVDSDVRWNVESQSLDDRTEEERGLQVLVTPRGGNWTYPHTGLAAEISDPADPLKTSRCVIPKARFDSVDSYISETGDKYNDIDLVYDRNLAKLMMDAGVDEILAKHVAHLFIRDPLCVYSDKLNLNDEVDSDHFEGLQSTNWQTVRFKPPPPNSEIGCRVEFRPMEIQVTDFENAAFVLFMVLVTRVILTFRLNLLLPMSLVEKNMKEAHKVDGVNNSKFFFRSDILPGSCPKELLVRRRSSSTGSQKAYAEMTINEIINGKPYEFPGLLPLIKDYLKSIEVDVETKRKLRLYLRFIKRKASGHLKTTAKWARDFVRSHPAYKFDSVVSEEINYDLMKLCRDLASGEAFDPSLLLTRTHPPEENGECESDDNLLSP